MKTFQQYLIATGLAFLCGATGNAQAVAGSEKDALAQAVAFYAQDVRLAALEVAAHPALVAKAVLLEQRAAAEFEQVFVGYSRRQQEAIWALMRYPQLLEELVTGGAKERDEIRRLSADYPRETRLAALQYGRSEHALLSAIHLLKQKGERALANMSADYDERTRRSMGLLLHHPELVALFAEDMVGAVLLGEAYEKNPQAVRRELQRLHLQQEHANSLEARDRADAAVGGEEDELEAVAQVYRERYGYDERNFDGPETNAEEVYVNTYNPYAYPLRYRYPLWYPPSHFYASVGWHITPRLRTSLYWYPRVRVYPSYGSPSYGPRYGRRHPPYSSGRGAVRTKNRRSSHRHR
jgi:hypothetical protein